MASASGTGLSDAQAIGMIADYIEPSLAIDAGDAWKTLKSWMMHFFPQDFRIEIQQEVLVKGRRIDFK